jgi:hypothetical protein
MNLKKVLYLFLALLLPGLIFVFLKKMGKNEFDLPVYYTEGVDSTDCQFRYSTPYILSDTLFKKDLRSSLSLFTFGNGAEGRRNLSKLTEEFADSLFTIRVIDSTEVQLARCALLIKEPWTTVLVDTRNQIRGYYRPDTREEFDRLKMEMSILLKRY